MYTLVLKHPLLISLCSDPVCNEAFSLSSDMKAMLRYEDELSKATAQLGLIPQEASEAISRACKTFEPNVLDLEAATQKDGLHIPELIRQLKAYVGEPYATYVHFGATSQDLIDTSLMMRLSTLLPMFEEKISNVLHDLAQLNEDYGSYQFKAHTRMQVALPITVSHKLQTWSSPLEEIRRELPVLCKSLRKLQLGGAVGNREAYQDKAQDIAKILANSLGLEDSECWHTNRLQLVKLTDWLSQLSGVMGKIACDISLLSQKEREVIVLIEGGTSSSMPHKLNPVKADVIVALSRYQATLSASMHQALIHENERSGSAWTLEWLTLPQMVIIASGALNTLTTLLQNIKFQQQNI